MLAWVMLLFFPLHCWWLIFLFNRWTAALIVIYVLYINGPGLRAAKTGTWPKVARKWAWWRYMAEYFPATIVRTTPLNPEDRYIFTVHPHGIITLASWVAFDTEGAGFAQLFPGIDLRVLTLNINFRFPIVRELLLSLGLCDASKETCINILSSGPGRAILLAVGGAAEALLAEPGTYDIILDKRKGFVKVALETGAHLVPVLLYGENDIFSTVKLKPGGWCERWVKRIQKALGFTTPIFWGRGLLPYRKPIDLVVGPPLPVPHVDRGALSDDAFDQLVAEYHEKYKQSLQQLWDSTHENYKDRIKSGLRIVQ